MPIAHGLADAIMPLLALIALLNPVIRPPLGDRPVVRRYLAATALGVVGIYLVALVDFALSLWNWVGLDYSTHTAFATTLAISIWRSRPGWSWALGAVLLLNAALILALGFHSVGDVVTSTVVAAIVTFPWSAQRAPGLAARGPQ
jgi:hypothetical protein